MVDFKKLRAAKPQSTVIHPVEIFRRLPKPPGITDIYVGQAQVLTVLLVSAGASGNDCARSSCRSRSARRV
jgi:hypothetical protein